MPESSEVCITTPHQASTEASTDFASTSASLKGKGQNNSTFIIFINFLYQFKFFTENNETLLASVGVKRKIDLTPKAQKLYHRAKRLTQRCQQLKRRSQQLRKSLNAGPIKQKVIKWLSGSFSDVVRQFILSQLENSSKKPKGRRFSTMDKLISVALWKTSSSAYNLLRRIFYLPSTKTLNKLLSTVDIETGIHYSVFKGMKNSSKGMKENKKCCVLMFDEMSLCPMLHPNFVKGNIDGFVDYGYRKSGDIAKHVQVRY